MKEIVQRVASAQMPVQRADGSFKAGKKDTHIINSDQVPMWIESHSNTQWGDKQNHTRRCVKTSGKEKDRFTVQLTVSKSGEKVSSRLFFW